MFKSIAISLRSSLSLAIIGVKTGLKVGIQGVKKDESFGTILHNVFMQAGVETNKYYDAHPEFMLLGINQGIAQYETLIDAGEKLFSVLEKHGTHLGLVGMKAEDVQEMLEFFMDSMEEQLGFLVRAKLIFTMTPGIPWTDAMLQAIKLSNESKIHLGMH